MPTSLVLMSLHSPSASAGVVVWSINGQSINVDNLSCASKAVLQPVIAAIDSTMGKLMQTGDYVVANDGYVAWFDTTLGTLPDSAGGLMRGLWSRNFGTTCFNYDVRAGRLNELLPHSNPTGGAGHSLIMNIHACNDNTVTLQPLLDPSPTISVTSSTFFPGGVSFKASGYYTRSDNGLRDIDPNHPNATMTYSAQYDFSPNGTDPIHTAVKSQRSGDLTPVEVDNLFASDFDTSQQVGHTESWSNANLTRTWHSGTPTIDRPDKAQNNPQGLGTNEVTNSNPTPNNLGTWWSMYEPLGTVKPRTITLSNMQFTDSFNNGAKYASALQVNNDTDHSESLDMSAYTSTACPQNTGSARGPQTMGAYNFTFTFDLSTTIHQTAGRLLKNVDHAYSDTLFFNNNGAGINTYEANGGASGPGLGGFTQLLGNWPGAFDPATTKAVTGDFNGDGWSDAIIINKNGAGVNAYEAFGSTSGLGSWTNMSSAYTGKFDPATTQMVAGDFNGDGYSDVFFINKSGTNVNAYIAYGSVFGLGDPQIVSGYNGNFDPAVTQIVSGDFNGDGYSDVFFINKNDIGTNAYEANGGPAGVGGFNVVSGYHGNFDPAVTKIAAGDFNQGGYSDVFFINNNGAGINAYEANGSQTGVGPFNVVPGYSGNFDPAVTKVVAGDYNGDGYSDVFFINKNDVGINAYEANGGGYGSQAGVQGFSVVPGYNGNFDPAVTVLADESA